MYEYARGKGIKVADYRADYFPQMIRRDIADIINNDIMSLVGKRAALLEVGLPEKSVSQLNKFIQRIKTWWFEWNLKRNYHADTYVYEDEENFELIEESQESKNSS